MGKSNCTGLLVVGHGTRSDRGVTEFWDLLDLVRRQLPATVVAGCFLELAEPTIATALDRLARRGVRRVLVMPLMLFEAGHAKRDIPRQISRAAVRLGLEFEILPALKDHPTMVKLSACRFQSTLEDHAIDPLDAYWVLVGRGSRDEAARAQFQDFFVKRQRLTPVGEGRTAFLAMASPRIETLVEDIAKAPQKWVVFQPHLLLAGELLARLQRMVDTQDRLSRRQQWLVTDHLGTDELVDSVIQQRYLQALGAQEVECRER